MKQIEIYTDGSCLKNPGGPGGWAAILLYKGHHKEIFGSDSSTTNNRMELMAIIKGLEELKEPCLVTIYSDSQYAINGMTKWLKNWIKKKFAGVKNKELWEMLSKASEQHTVNYKWVKGHANNEYNNLADEIANKAARSVVLTVDSKNIKNSSVEIKCQHCNYDMTKVLNFAVHVAKN
mgnify:CR=1 FL=1